MQITGPPVENVKQKCATLFKVSGSELPQSLQNWNESSKAGHQTYAQDSVSHAEGIQVELLSEGPISL